MKIILDVDTGTDDAVAVMMAALHPDVDLLACTTVRGNLDVETTTANTLAVLDHIGFSDVPVHRGQATSLVPLEIPTLSQRATAARARMHPSDLGIPASTRQAEPQAAVDFLVETLRAATEPITIVAVAPLTNIAAAIITDPSIVGAIDRLVIMGGAHDFGNVTPAAEANIWYDPFAADVVLRAGIERVVLVPLDATHQALITQDQSARLAAAGTPAAVLASELIDHRITIHDQNQPQPIPHSAAIHDALCIAYLLDESVIQLEEHPVGVETRGDRTFGRTVIDRRRRGDESPNAQVAFHADRERFFDLMLDSLSRARAH